MFRHVFALCVHQDLEIFRPCNVCTSPFFGHRQFNSKVVLHHESAQAGVRPNRTRDSSTSQARFIIEHALSQRMVKTDKFNIVVSHCDIAIERHRHASATAHATVAIGIATAFAAQIRLAVHAATASAIRRQRQVRHARHRTRFDLRSHRDEETIRHRTLLDIESAVYQRIEHEILEFRFIVKFLNFVRNFLCLFRIAGVEFEQAVTTVLDVLAHQFAIFLDLRNHILYKVIETYSRRRKRLNQRFRIFEEEFAAAHQRSTERIQAFVVPAEHHFLTGAFHVRHVDDDILVLPNAVQAANTLFNKSRIERQIEQHQVMRELEVAAFGANFRSDEQVSAIGLAKVCSGLVTRHDAHVFVEHHERALAQEFEEQSFKSLHHLDRFANQQNLFVLVFLEETLEPYKAFVQMPSVRESCTKETVLLNVRRSFEVAVGSHFHHFAVSRIRFERNLIEHALREAANALTRIAEHHGTRAHAIDNAAHPFARRHRL